MTRPVHVVVVAYHGAAELGEALESVVGQAARVTVVDNSSSVDVASVAARARVHYVDAGANLGFGPGANVALREIVAGAPCDVLLLNPDAVLAEHALEALQRCLHDPERGRVAAVSARLVDLDGDEQRVMWPFPSPRRAWLEALGLGGDPDTGGYAIGAVLLLRWEAIAEIGLFDERFFLYAEETDWQRRAAAAGWVSACCEAAVARHRGAGTSSDPERREALFHAAHEIYVRKWFGPRGWAAFRAAACAGAAVRAMVQSGPQRSAALRRLRLYARGPKRCAAAFAGD